MREMRFWAGLVVGLRLDCVHRPDCYPMGPAPDGVVSICRLTCLSHETFWSEEMESVIN
jgi:hypothetical protein